MSEREVEILKLRVQELEELVIRLIKKLGLEKDLFENYQISKDHGKVLEVLGFSGYTIEKERALVSNFIVENELLEMLQTVGRKIWKIFGNSVKGIEILNNKENLTIAISLLNKEKEKESKLESIWQDISKEKSNLVKFVYLIY
ncbi:MAG TPA: hypothetical protein ENO30_00210 [Thermodesulfobium narugense]|uniref:Uncharacterized protein n=1 Tax=Thermodesulfobium acidiphilum TaxID=1794699 RepID=A0A2R4VYH4_THEAF|nr:hypothetical protein [Thermodesulfobium acidiphilum]AWB09514.1 hypothetical protein TDSAC_0127 [Thermodesulfobium acidiphilum]PMP85893.1 MAG: hypothetical protein C0174_03100 [Thermodesulfobium narugense]HEM55162.1 hypothetical protein [Thermodesulfobium narugense]